jgi:hypothetical protein
LTTHQPSQPEPLQPEQPQPQQPNPTQLPVEPEFGPALPPAEPEDPGVPRPAI